jgi:hypothetical protein
LCQPYRVVDVAGLGYDAEAQLLQHVRNHHPDQGIVFDKEY